MKFLILFILVVFSTNSYSKVEICHRRAQIFLGLVSHYWIKTDTKIAGMGSENLTGDEQVGDKFESPLALKVYIIDHSNQTPLSCKEKLDIDEDCVNAELDLGKPLGYFSPTNNCQVFTRKIIKKCAL